MNRAEIQQIMGNIMILFMLTPVPTTARKSKMLAVIQIHNIIIHMVRN
jgi:hypothetical protein